MSNEEDNIRKAEQELEEYGEEYHRKRGVKYYDDFPSSQELLGLKINLYNAERNEAITKQKRPDTPYKPLDYAGRAMLTSILTIPIGAWLGNAMALATKSNELIGWEVGFVVGIAIALLGSIRRRKT